MTDMHHADAEPKKFTSVQILLEDAEWLRARQREISFKRGSYITMYELLNEVISRARDTGEGA